MIRKISSVFLLASSLFSANIIAAPTIAITEANLGYDLSPYTLAPNEPQSLVNFLFQTIKASCVINTKDASNVIYVEVLSKTGTVNGIPMKEGSNLSLTVHDKDKLEITVDRAAKVNLTNLGPNAITATCSVK